MAVTVWLAHWSQERPEEQERPYYVIVLAAFVAAAVVLSLQRSIFAFYSMAKVKKGVTDVMHCGGGGTGGVEVLREWKRGLCNLGSFDRNPNPNPYGMLRNVPAPISTVSSTRLVPAPPQNNVSRNK